jgi:hypothetical protein
VIAIILNPYLLTCMLYLVLLGYISEQVAGGTTTIDAQEIAQWPMAIV